MPVIPVFLRGEAGRLLEPRRLRLQGAGIMPWHSGVTRQDSVSKNNNK